MIRSKIGLAATVAFASAALLMPLQVTTPAFAGDKTADEKLYRRDINSGIILLSWTEKDGTNVVDVLDLQTMALHANAVLANGKRFFTKAKVTEIK